MGKRIWNVSTVSLETFLGGGRENPTLRVWDDEQASKRAEIRPIDEVDLTTEFSLDDVDFCSITNDDYSLAEFKNHKGIALLNRDPYEGLIVVGEYHQGTLFIHPDHRGKKLSIPLILACSALLNGPPTEDDFTSAGYAAHLAAHEHAVGSVDFQQEELPRLSMKTAAIPALR